VTTANDAINETQRLIYGGGAFREQFNTLSEHHSAGQTAMIMTYALRGITVGSLLEVGTELMLVQSTDETNQEAVVLRGQLGSTATTHEANDVVTVNPKFPRFSIFKAINEELGALSAEGLFRVRTVDLTYNAAVDGYDLTSVTDLLDVYSVRYQVPGPSLRWPAIKAWKLDRNMPTTDFASGIALILDDGGYPGRTVRVSYFAPFTQLSTTSDDIATVSGLHTEAHDILPLGAAARLTMTREVKRGFTEAQGDTRRADEVPVGTSMASGRGLMQLRDRRVQQEVARLRRFYPPHLSTTI